MRRNSINNKWLWNGIVAFTAILPFTSNAQSIKRQCISSYGSSVVTENGLIGQTAGQSFNTTLSSGPSTVLQGFQQPNTFSLEERFDPDLKELNVLVYPNPADRSVTISSTEAMEQSLIRVTDLQGKYILAEKVPRLLNHKINCASWVNGIYFITIQDAQLNSKTLRLIISK